MAKASNTMPSLKPFTQVSVWSQKGIFWRVLIQPSQSLQMNQALIQFSSDQTCAASGVTRADESVSSCTAGGCAF